MRICFFKANSLLVGAGAENLLIEVGSRLAEKHEVIIVALDDLPDRRISSDELIQLLDGIVYTEIPSFRLPRGAALPTLSGLLELKSVVETSDLTYVVLPASPTDLIFGILGKTIRKPLVAGIHGFLRSDMLLQRLYMSVFRRILRKFDAHHITSEEARKWFDDENLRNVYFIPNGVDTERFKFTIPMKETTQFNILYTGRLSEEKGADLLIEIINLVNSRRDRPDVVFTIAGSGDFAPNIIEIEEKYDNVIYLGFVDSYELPSVYNEAHLYLIPSRKEGMPLRLLEAQSCGLPSLGSRISGITDIIIERETGRLIDSFDIKGFVDAIIHYHELWCTSPNDYTSLREQIRQSIVSRYDWKKSVEAIERMFKDLTDKSDN
jgi:glycosyltransferase involved in cell wall biosynthesis